MFHRLILPVILLMCLLVACSRDRTPTTTTATTEPTLVVLTNTVNSGSGEPLVTVNVPTQTTGVETPAPAVTLTPSTIDYYVKDGDTLSSVAADFGIDTETVRRLNYLLDDNIFVGQILQMPYTEGVTAEGVPTATPEPYRYRVAAGDSLTSIALQFNVSTVAIMEANSMSDANSLFVGQELEIPGYVETVTTNSSTTQANTTTAEQAGAPSSTTGEGVTHIVQPGETLFGVAQTYGIDPNVLAQANNISNRNQLRVGQQLVIPGISALDAAAARGAIHVIQSGESLSSIAAQYGVTAQEIIDLNGISNPDAIYVGQQLIIPE